MCNKKIENIFLSSDNGNKNKKKMSNIKKNCDKIQAYKDWCIKVGLDIKDHQIEGFQWCLNHENNPGVRGGIIADEMGLGKTITMLACIRHNFQARTLIVLPPALLSQWVGVFQRFLGHTPFIYHGKRAKNISIEDLEKKAIVLTTYGMISPRKDEDKVKYTKLHKIVWSRIIYDEAHHLRNFKTKVHDGAIKLKANIRWMVTGTPINNNIKDFYALCKILELPLTDMTLLKSHMLRRTKVQVGIKLPPIKNHLIAVEWASEEESDVAEQIHSMMNFTGVNRENVDDLISWLSRCLFSAMTRAKQICIYPQLLHNAVTKMKAEGIVPQNLAIKNIKTNSKIDAVVDTILKNRNSGKRKLVFSHYRGEIDVLCKHLRLAGLSVQLIDGRTKKRDKKSRVQSVLSETDFRSVCKSWNALPDELVGLITNWMAPEVMIVQIQTACEGLNMQHFQEIYFTSPHWNPAVEDQAVARAHRIGQNKTVDVYRFVMNGFGRAISFEQYCTRVQDCKREIMNILK